MLAAAHHLCNRCGCITISDPFLQVSATCFQKLARTALFVCPFRLPQALPLDISCEQAAGPGCAALVADMCSLFEELKRLSQLDQEGELEVRSGGTLDAVLYWPAQHCGSSSNAHACHASSQVWHGRPDQLSCLPAFYPARLMRPLPQDTPTRWFAANFLGQDHPLADAMQAQVRRRVAGQGMNVRRMWKLLRAIISS